ncbi:MAG TPA: leucine-rich repeat domain-containing protein [Permianibacter sp.]|nr:leucine-rich repeat domain-containing protein [Permianibacter sp.]
MKGLLRLPAALACCWLAFAAHAETPYTVQLTPKPNPTVIASSGGVVRYDRLVQNQTNASLSLNYRGLLIRPDGSEMPMTTDLSLSLAAFANSNITGLGFSLPSYFPAGNYHYRLYYREAGKSGYSQHAFPFSKSGSNPAPTPRLSLSLTGATTTLPKEGGTVTVNAVLKNTSAYNESLRSWSVLTLPNGDKRVLNEVVSRSLAAGTSVSLANAVANISAADPTGDYQLTYYAISNSRNTPAIVQRISWHKDGMLISDIELPDPALMQCLHEQASRNGWVTVDHVTALDCVNKGIRSAAGLQQLTALQQLNLAENEIDSVGTPQLPPSLQVLSLAANRLHDIGIISPLPELRELDLANNRLTRLTGFEQLSQLEALNLANNDLDNGYELEQVLSQTVLLKRLNLAGVWLADTPITSWLSSLAQLQELDLSNTGVADPYFPLLPELRVLRLAGNSNIDLVRIAALPQLKALDLSDTGLLTIEPLLPLTQLEELRLSGNTALPVHQVEQLLRQLPNLKRLALADLLMPFDVVSVLMQSNSHHAIEVLDLANTAQQPAELPFANLRELNLSDNPVQFLPPLPRPEQLQVLKLANMPLRSLPQAPEFRALNVLDLSGSVAIPDWERDAAITSSGSLQELYLANLVIPVRLQDLAWVRPDQFAELRVLDVRHASVDLMGFVAPSLRRLLLAGPAIIEPLSPIFAAHALRELALADLSMRHQYLMVHDLEHLSLENLRQFDPYQLESLLQQNPALRQLHIRGLMLPNAAPLQSLIQLQSLTLADVGLAPWQASSLQNLSKLREIDLSDNRLDVFTTAPYLRLQRLRLQYAALNDLFLEFNHGAFSPQWQLRELDLSGNPQLAERGILWQLSGLSALEVLALDELDLRSKSLSTLLPNSQRLKSLSLRNTGIRWDGAMLASLRHLALTGADLSQLWLPPVLESLDLSYPTVSVPNLWLPYGLRELRLAGTNMEPHVYLDHVRFSPMLRVLDIRDNNLSGLSVHDLLMQGQPDGNPLLHTLDISNTGLAVQGELWILPGLRHLGMAGLQLATLPVTRQPLLSLDVADNQLNDLPPDRVQHLLALDISNNPGLTTEFLRMLFNEQLPLRDLALAKMPQLDLQQLFSSSLSTLQNLNKLDVSENNLNQLWWLDGLALHELDVSSNQLADLNDLMYGFEALRRVDLRANDNLSCDAINALRSTRPLLQVTAPATCPLY